MTPTAISTRAKSDCQSRTVRQTAADLAFCARALKAPALLDAAERLAERAQAESWSHLEYLVACLQREVSARDSHGGEGRIRAAVLDYLNTGQAAGMLIPDADPDLRTIRVIQVIRA